MLPAATEHKELRTFPRRSDGGYHSGLGRSPTASWSSSQQGDDEVDVAARLAWTSAASRRATGRPDAVGIRAPPPGTVTGDPACRANAGRLEAEIRRPSPFDKIADAADGITRTHGPC